MPGFLIKKMPPKLHRKLKETAARNRRSMTQEALFLLENSLKPLAENPVSPPPPFKGRFPLTPEFIDAAKRKGRK